jgi:hypothetical protein
MTLKISELKKKFEKRVKRGIVDKGFFVNNFSFEIPEPVKNIFNVAEDFIDTVYISFIAYIPNNEVVEFQLEHFKHKSRSINTYSKFYNYYYAQLKLKENRKKEEYYPIVEFHMYIHLNISEVPKNILDFIKSNKSIFKEFIEKPSDSIVLILEIKNFKFDFDYYGKIL